MMPMVQEPVDAAYETGPEPKMSITIAGRERPRREVLDDNRRLAAENARLAEENHALREAATLVDSALREAARARQSGHLSQQTVRTFPRLGAPGSYNSVAPGYG